MKPIYPKFSRKLARLLLSALLLLSLLLPINGLAKASPKTNTANSKQESIVIVRVRKVYQGLRQGFRRHKPEKSGKKRVNRPNFWQRWRKKRQNTQNSRPHPGFWSRWRIPRKNKS